MKKVLNIIAAAAIALATVGGVASCKKEVKMTSIIVQDSIRHYYPMVQGTDLELSYRIANTGKDPLVLTDIQPSCGCISHDLDKNNIVLPGEEALFKFTLHSDAYTGYVRHTIRLYGNIYPKGMACLIFDTNVVQPAQGSPDYEERQKNREDLDIVKGVKELVDGTSSQRGYWTDMNEYSRGYNKYLWKEIEK